MGADVTIYCLEQITDYMEFERLCHDLMSLVGYTSIEPLGGFKDKGRDAIHINMSGRTTIFAYSVREDWRAKLAEDAGKIHKHSHSCDKLVFITTEMITPGDRDEAVASIKEQYKWDLELYGLERLRIMLDVQFPHIKVHHPQIFPPGFLEFQKEKELAKERDHLLISFAPEDKVTAEWLACKLTAEGYLVWCARFRNLGGESFPDDVDDAIQKRVSRVVALYSQASLSNPDIVRQRAIALGLAKQIPNFVVALRVEYLPPEYMDQATLRLSFLPFETNWAEGLELLLDRLEDLGCHKLLPNGRSIAVRASIGNDVLSKDPEIVVTNTLQIQSLPDLVLRFSPQQAISFETQEEMKVQWAFRAVTDNLLVSFHSPPQSIVDTYGLKLVGRGSWKAAKKVEGIATKNLVSELVRKALLIKCIQKGLRYCPVTGLCYFPPGLVTGDKIKYCWPNGKTSSINTVGERKYGWRDERYRYYLAPDFFVSQNLQDEFTILVRIHVRITNLSGDPLPSGKANSRRKDLCGDWWNGEWLSRLLAVCQYLAENNSIVIGMQTSEQIVIAAEPMCLIAPKGVNETALDKESYEREDILLPQEDHEDKSGEEEEGS